MAKLIDTLELPQGIRQLNLAGLQQVVDELRDELIDTVSASGGHFASSLGAAEISVALHYLLDTPRDRIVWDTGHQGYIHKMLTGRRAQMRTIRKRNGLSGFLSRSESEYDCFGAGHAGTSISAAVGMAAALQQQDSTRKVVAVIGDGSMTAGMAFEALNHAGDLGLQNLIVLLNDNEMSNSPNVGAISWLFSRAVTSRASTRARHHIKNLYRKGYVPKLVYDAIDRAEEAAQGFICSPAMLFEAFGFRYIGPVDGHNIAELITALTHAKQQEVPVLVHARTRKGKGYLPAEDDPLRWHSTTPFDRKRGIALSQANRDTPTYTEVFGGALVELAAADRRVVGITAAMADGTGLDKLQRMLPGSFYDVGICEQHAVTFAAGLACEGFRPVCAIYSTFMQRAFDQILNDVCIQKLPVVLAMDRGGVVGNDGETHQGVFDVSYLRFIPNLTIMAPGNENELRHMLYTALQHDGPVALRYPRGAGSGVALDAQFRKLEIGKAEMVQRGSDLLLLCYGHMLQTGIEAAAQLAETGIEATVINARFVKPLDTALLAEEIPRYPLVCTIEDGCLSSGFGAAVLEFVNDKKIPVQNPIHRFGVGDVFVPHATQAEQRAMNNFDAATIVSFIRGQFVRRKLAAVG